MIEENGRTYQTGNGTPTTPKKILRALVKDGMCKGFIHKYKEGATKNVVEGYLHPRKEYFGTFEALSLINPDVILRSSSDELVFLYQI